MKGIQKYNPPTYRPFEAEFHPIQFILAIWALSCLFFRKFPVMGILSLCCVMAVASCFVMTASTTERIIIVQKEAPIIKEANVSFGEAPAPPFVGKESKFSHEAPICAPKAPKEQLTTVQYIKKFAPRAKKDMKKYGVPASISLAQGIVESRSGKSLLALKCNNHFGMKCFSKKHRGCCMKFNDDNNNDSFVMFDTPEQSWDYHAKKLSEGRYAPLKKYGSDYRKWAHGLKAKGYATDKAYASTLVGVIERYELYKYDR